MQTRHTLDWAQKVHTARWYCDVDHENFPEFDDQFSFKEHLRTEHGDRLSNSQQSGRARRNLMTTARHPFVCPLCDCVPNEIQTRLQEKPYQLLAEHIAQHIKSIAFYSLSYLDLGDGDRESEPGLSESTSMQEAGPRSSLRLSDLESLSSQAKQVVPSLPSELSVVYLDRSAFGANRGISPVWGLQSSAR